MSQSEMFCIRYLQPTQVRRAKGTRRSTPRRLKRALLVIALFLPMLVTMTARGDEPAANQTLICDVGPIEKTYGMTKWLVYSCNDGRSVVIASAPDSPANPFVFRFLARGNTYLLQSAGTGDRKFTTAAFGELKQMTGQDIAALIALTIPQAK